MQASIDKCLRGGVPFAAYRMPGEDRPELILQYAEEVTSFLPGEAFPLDSGYIAMPFSPARSNPSFMIVPDLVLEEDEPERIDEGRSLSEPSHPSPEPSIDREQYLEALSKLIDLIQNKAGLEKVVMSRVSEVQRDRGSPGTLFERLCASYPGAYVHIFHIPGHGVWVGATPETLIELGPGTGRIQALAGTRPKGGDKGWSEKEEREQASVADHIEKVLEEADIPILQKEGPHTVGAGTVEHLSTQFLFSSGRAVERISLLLKELHPTPAVCGVPRDRAMQLIEESEVHRRSFYAGAVGPWNVKGRHALYVNLRCLRIFPDRYQLYIGGGINSGSVPEDEWAETEWKAETIRQVLK